MTTWKMNYWWHRGWWAYLLAEPFTLAAFWCRMHGHPCGPVWFNVGALEPDMRCKNCGDYLG